MIKHKLTVPNIQYSVMCSSRKYPCPLHGRLMEIPRGGGFHKPNFLNESMTLKWDFRRGGGGFNLKNLPW